MKRQRINAQINKPEPAGASWCIYSKLKTGDSDALKDMCCEKLKNSEDFDEKIDEIMNFIDGEIISDGRQGSGSGGYGPTWETLRPTIYAIETDKGKFYRVGLSIYIENENPDMLGIYAMGVSLVELNGQIWTTIDSVNLYTD